MDVFRSEFIRHMFAGTRALCPGSECTAVVKGEQWPQTVGIRVIDNTLQWVEQDALSIEDFVRIYGALVEIEEVKHMAGE